MKTWRHERIILCICDRQVSFGQIMFSHPNKIFPVRRWFVCPGIFNVKTTSLIKPSTTAMHSCRINKWFRNVCRQRIVRDVMYSSAKWLTRSIESSAGGYYIGRITAWNLHWAKLITEEHVSGNLVICRGLFEQLAPYSDTVSCVELNQRPIYA